ncbi:DUF1737 domain-containing protein [Aquimarina sp. AD10]|uniref:DUF1737 domain-containing protein n=1 Tax=Aquimarina TaxID=290174 RepID=UPI0009ED9C28|nr:MULTISPECIES: DUF1737 domain-containing protein [Aquimarina]AXT60905.1 DUF1737 domain-containing protein [Aquimarina sp. AD10]RKM95547.1 DUF1737 domain-containing protein [Aquimarina sp. AD10]
MKYKIVSAQTENKLENKVNVFLDDDWKPTGSMFILNYGGELGLRFFQPIVSEE